MSRLKGKYHHSEETRQKISKSSKGKKCPWARSNPQIFEKGRHYSLKTEFKKGNAPWNKGKKCPQIKHDKQFKKGHIWSNEIEEKRIRNTIKGLFKSPTKPERFLIDLFKENNLPFDFVGNGSIIIEGFNPDFMDNNGNKKIIEMNGDYIHNLPNMIEKDKRKLEAYKKYGFTTLVLWEHELQEENKQQILNKIKNFVTGEEITK